MSMQTDSGATHPMLSYTDKLATQWTDFLLLAGRVVLGWIFVMYGWAKLFGIPEYAATFPRRGLSTWMAYIAVPAEFFVGLALILGFATRYAVLIMLFYMIVASSARTPTGTFRRRSASTRWRTSGRTFP